jgi:hypothetical protein
MSATRQAAGERGDVVEVSSRLIAVSQAETGDVAPDCACTQREDRR